MLKVFAIILAILCLILGFKACNIKHEKEFELQQQQTKIEDDELNIVNGKDFRKDMRSFAGKEWSLMTNKQKIHITYEFILKMHYVNKDLSPEGSEGRHDKLQAEIDYFISGLDSFYGTKETDKVDVLQAIVLLDMSNPTKGRTIFEH